MNWLNLELATLRSEEYLGSDPIQRATWLNLLAYCADQENGGVIAGCTEWGSRRWLQLLGVTKEEVMTESSLWSFCGKSIHVWKYPKVKEIEVKKNRENGRRGGRPPKTKDNKPDGSVEKKPSGSESLKRKGKEGKGKEEKKDVSPLLEFALPEKRHAILTEWLAYKKEKGQGYKPAGLKALIKKISVHSDDVLREAVDQAMVSNWAGLFPEKVDPSKHQTQEFRGF